MWLVMNAVSLDANVLARCVSSDEHQVMSTATGLLAQLRASVYLHWHDIAQQARRRRHIVLV